MKVIYSFFIILVGAYVFANPHKHICVLQPQQMHTMPFHPMMNRMQHPMMQAQQQMMQQYIARMQMANLNKNANNNNNINANNIRISLKGLGSNGVGSNSLTGLSGGVGTGTSTTFGSDGRSWAYSPAYSPSYAPSNAYSPSSSFSNMPSFNASYMPGFSNSGYSNGAANNVPLPIANGAADDPRTAWLTVKLPHEQSTVYLNGTKMPHKGIQRKYVTPPLDPKKTYHYALKVVYPDGKGGKKIYHANIELKAGDEITHVVVNDVIPPPPRNGPVPLPKQIPIEDQLKVTENRLQMKLKFAKNLFENNKKEKAKTWLRDIIDKHPESKAAQDAKVMLEKFKK